MIQILICILIAISTQANAQPSARSEVRQNKFNHGVKAICHHRGLILNAARIEKVSPRHMIGCLLSEYTYLKNAADVAVDVAAFTGFYWDPSLGFTQIKLSTARGIARELYNEYYISDQHIIFDLLSPRVATRYMAHLIHNIVLDYKKAGFDIAGSTGLVCSSYLVGNSSRRAMNHKRNSTLPELNYYGRFAIKNEATVIGIESGRLCR